MKSILGECRRNGRTGIARAQFYFKLCAFSVLLVSSCILILENSVLAQFGPASIEQTAAVRPQSKSPESRLKSKSSFHEIARQMLAEARKLVKRGDIEGARRLATRAKSLNVDWSLLNDSPENFLQELDGPSVSATNKKASPLERFTQTDEEKKFNRTRVIPTPLPLEFSNQPQKEIGRWKSLDKSEVKSADLYVTEPESAEDFSNVPGSPFDASPQTIEINPRNLAPTAPDDQLDGQSDINLAPALLGLRNESIRSADSPENDQESDASGPLMTTALVQLGSTLVGFVFGLLAFCLAFPFLVRKYASKLGTILQVELVNSQMPNILNYSTAPQQHPSSDTVIDDRDGRAVDFADQPFPFKVVGSEFEDQRLSKEEEARIREEEIMKHIFEENLELQDRISGLHEDAA